jgi:hypothetical protein
MKLCSSECNRPEPKGLCSSKFSSASRCPIHGGGTGNSREEALLGLHADRATPPLALRRRLLARLTFLKDTDLALLEHVGRIYAGRSVDVIDASRSMVL